MNGTTKRTRRAPRITAMAISLLLSISAVACARPDGPDNSTSYIAQPPEIRIPPIFDLSTISDPKIRSDETTSFTGPVPVYPEEHETTLKLVKTYPVGQDNSWLRVYMWYEQDPSYAEFYITDCFFLASNGSVYAREASCFRNLDTGEAIEIPNCSDIFDVVEDQNGNFYGLSLSAIVQFTADHGVIKQFALPGSGYRYGMFLTPDNELALEREDGFYTIDGKSTSVTGYTLKQIPISDVQASIPQGIPNTPDNQKDSATILTLFGKQYLVDPSAMIRDWTENGICITEYQSHSFQNHDYLDETIFTHYTKEGNPLSKTKINAYHHLQKIPCEIICNQDGKQAVCKEYAPITVTVDTTVFENVWRYYPLSDPDGTNYLFLVYPDKADLYRIHAGYSNITLTDFSQAEESKIIPTSTSSSSIPHVTLTRDQALTRAETMINMAWKVQAGHKVLRGDAILPTQVHNAGVNTILLGIPYCYGGFNGLDTTGSSYTHLSFPAHVHENDVDHSMVTDVYMAGDVNHDGSSHRDGTIGLDCSGFVSSVYGYTDKQSTISLPTYGHTVHDLSQLQEMDLLVKTRFHCYLFGHSITIGYGTPAADCCGCFLIF